MTSFKAIQLIPILDLPAEVSPTKLACLDAISTTLADVSGEGQGSNQDCIFGTRGCW